MRATRVGVEPLVRHVAILLADLELLVDLFGGAYPQPGGAPDDHLAIFLAQFDSRDVGVHEVLHVFQARPRRASAVGRWSSGLRGSRRERRSPVWDPRVHSGVPRFAEDVLDRARHDPAGRGPSWAGRQLGEGVALAGARLAVGHDGAVVALQDLLDNGPRHCLVDVLLGAGRGERGVELELFARVLHRHAHRIVYVLVYWPCTPPPRSSSLLARDHQLPEGTCSHRHRPGEVGGGRAHPGILGHCAGVLRRRHRGRHVLVVPLMRQAGPDAQSHAAPPYEHVLVEQHMSVPGGWRLKEAALKRQLAVAQLCHTYGSLGFLEAGEADSLGEEGRVALVGVVGLESSSGLLFLANILGTSRALPPYGTPVLRRTPGRSGRQR
eukprot:scaffold4990_cov387-Prasinococcus_capsulatus_cf.AAC.36